MKTRWIARGLLLKLLNILWWIVFNLPASTTGLRILTWIGKHIPADEWDGGRK